MTSGTKLSASALTTVNSPGIPQWEPGDQQFAEAERLNLEVAAINLVKEEEPFTRRAAPTRECLQRDLCKILGSVLVVSYRLG